MKTIDTSGLRAGTRTLDDLFDTLARPEWGEIRRRCALLRVCTAEGYAEAVRGVAGAPGFEEWRKQEGLSDMGGAGLRYGFAPQKREEALLGWLNDRDGLRRFAGRMMRYYRKAGDRLCALTMGLFVKEEEAATAFAVAYAQADGAFDLAQCTMLLEILRAREMLLGERTRSLYYDLSRYREARGMFGDDYYRSASFLERAEQLEAFEAFWGERGEWLLRLYGRGGSGKTMLVRWLVARRCVERRPGREPILVAKVDFDYLNLAAFGRRPWLILAPIARQFAAQPGGTGMQTVAGEMLELVRVLAGAEGAGSGAEADIDGRQERLVKDFRKGLGERAAMVVLDTCEEPLLQRAEAFESLLELLAQMREDGCAGLRVLVSGRYDIGEKGRLERFRPEGRTIRVERFGEEESRRYLVEKRGMKAGALVRAIARQAEGNPFVLGLFADLAEGPEGLRVEEVEAAPAHDFVYLLDRVILRIAEEPVRWLVRYAAVARELRFPFVAAVLAPLLAERERDAANEFGFDERLQRRYGQREPWPAGEMEQVRKMWEQLIRYASHPSWIVYQPETESLKLSAEVVGPMRALLRRQDGALYEEMQRRAEEYWRAESPAEAMYHRFLRLGGKAVGDWKELAREARYATPRARRELGELVLDPGIAELVGEPAVMRGRFLIGFAALAERLRAREGAARRKAEREMERQWREVGRRRPAEVAGMGAASVSEYRMLQAAVGYFAGHRAQPLRLFRGARVTGEMRLLALVAVTRMEQERALAGKLAPQQALVDGARARQMAEKLRSTEFPVGYLDYRDGLYLFRLGRLREGLERFRSGLERLGWDGEMGDYKLECFWRAAATLRLLGRWEEALALAEQFRARYWEEAPDRNAVRVAAALAAAHVWFELGEDERCRSELFNAMDHHGYTGMEGAAFALMGEWELEQGKAGEALGWLGKAMERHPEGGYARERAQMLMARAGNRTDKGALPRFVAGRHPSLEVLETRLRMGGTMLPMPGPARSAGVSRARVLAAALAMGKRGARERLEKELKGLDERERFVALTALRGRAATVKGGRLRWLPAAPGEIGTPMGAVRAIALAKALLVCGEMEEARELARRIPPQGTGRREAWRQEVLAAVAEEVAPVRPQERTEQLLPALDGCTIDWRGRTGDVVVRYGWGAAAPEVVVNKGTEWLGGGLERLLGVESWEGEAERIRKMAGPLRAWSRGRQVRLVCDSETTAAAPWEYACSEEAASFTRGFGTPRAEAETVRWMQWALRELGESIEVNGDGEDRRLRALLREMEAPEGVHRELRRRLRERRVDRWKAGRWLKLGRVQASRTPRTSEFRSVPRTPEMWLRHKDWRIALLGQEVSLVAFAGQFRRDRDDEILLEYGPGEEERVPLSLLAGILRDRPAGQLRPVVLLRAISEGEGQWGEQLVLRNLYCARLFRTGATPAVIGAGHEWAEAEAVGRSVGQVHLDLLRWRPEFPPVLWTDDPELPVTGY